MTELCSLRRICILLVTHYLVNSCYIKLQLILPSARTIFYICVFYTPAASTFPNASLQYAFAQCVSILPHSVTYYLLFQIAFLCLHLIEKASPLTTGDKCSLLDWANQLSNLPEASKLAVRLHLLSLLFEEMKMSCAECVENSEILDLLVRLLDSVQGCLSTVKDAATPK